MKPYWIFLVVLLLAAPLCAQQPDTLQYSVPPPPGTGAQGGAGLGYSVAMDGNYTVVGAPYDDLHGSNSGVVKVFNSATGALLHVIPNPSPAENAVFGWSVAISGTRVVAGTVNTGSVYVYDLDAATPTVPLATLHSPAPATGDNFGYSVAVSGTRVVVGAHGDGTAAYQAGTAYVYDLSSGTPTVPVAMLNNPDPEANDIFGWSVGISGTRVVVGARFDDTGALDAGSAYVYDLSSGTPTVPVATLNDPGPAVDDNFGYSVGISGTRVVVGAPYDDTGASNAGRAYVYDLSGVTPTVPVATYDNPSPAANDNFGYSVAISGTRVVVGAPFDNTTASDSGSAYLYDAGNLSGQTPYSPIGVYNNPSPSSNDRFGRAVAASGARVVVGAYQDDTGATDAGSAYVFGPTGVVTLNNPGPATNDLFGYSVAISGTRMVVGAHVAFTGAINPGIAYVYDLSGATPTAPMVTLNNPNPAAADFYGDSVAISGTLVVVGAPYDDAGAANTGSAYVYDLAGPTPAVPVATLNNPTPAIGDYFGDSVAISGTLVMVGAPYDDTGASDAGSAYVYDVNGATPNVPLVTLNNPSLAANEYFGYSVSISGTRVVVGASGDGTGASGAGSAYVYDLNGATPNVPVLTLNNPSPAAYDAFGRSVAISGTLVVVGARADDTGATNAGSAYVYDLSGVSPTVPVATLNNPSPATGDLFGESVAISGTRVVVGCDRDNTGAAFAGRAYIYDLSRAPTAPAVTLNNPAPAVSDYFGRSVAIDGTTVVIGTPYDDSVLSDKGFVYVFGPPPNIQVEAPLGQVRVSGGLPLNFGIQPVEGGLIIGFTHRIKNTGLGTLTGLVATIVGAAPDDFALSALPPETLLPGESFQFVVRFDPTAPGTRTATLSLASDDPDENPFLVPLQGIGLTAQEAWRLQYFLTLGNTGNAADDADPDGDGDENLFEFVAGLVPNDPASRFQLRVEPVAEEPGQKAIVFGPVIAGRTYEVKSKASLSDPTWEPLGSFTTSDNGPERTVIDLGAGAGPKFYTVEIVRP